MTPDKQPVFRGEGGFTLLETMMATALLSMVMCGLISVSFVALTTTENQGHLSARATEYGQDKLEQLLVLAYGDASSDTTQFPAPTVGGTGLSIGGSSDPTAPVAGYVDYLDANGNLLGGGATAPASWYYKRVWQIASPAANLKQITVTTIVSWSVGKSVLPTSTLAAIKANPF
jgi:prepilin-type N-terminal cleavage/methylation domain-containing protein